MSLSPQRSILAAKCGSALPLLAWVATLSRVWRRWTRGEREAYFAQATDLADLERRQRAWDQQQDQRQTVRGGGFL